MAMVHVITDIGSKFPARLDGQGSSGGQSPSSFRIPMRLKGATQSVKRFYLANKGFCSSPNWRFALIQGLFEL